MGTISFNNTAPTSSQPGMLTVKEIIVEKPTIIERPVIIEKEVMITPNLEEDFHELYLKIINELKTLHEENKEQNELDLNELRLELLQQISINKDVIEQMKKTYKVNIQELKSSIEEEIEIVDTLQQQLSSNIKQIHEKYDTTFKFYNKLMIGVVVISIISHFIF